MNDPEVLTLDEVLGIHADQIRSYGGRQAFAISGFCNRLFPCRRPRSTMSFYMAPCSRWPGPVLFHLVRNHPFVDGNKRTALMCALVFLGLNGSRLDAEPDALYRMVDGVASGEVDKADVSVFLRDRGSRR